MSLYGSYTLYDPTQKIAELCERSPIFSRLSARLSDVETNLGRLKIRLKAEFVIIYTINLSQTDNSSLV